MESVENGHLNIVEFLIEHGSDINNLSSFAQFLKMFFCVFF